MAMMGTLGKEMGRYDCLSAWPLDPRVRLHFLQQLCSDRDSIQHVIDNLSRLWGISG